MAKNQRPKLGKRAVDIWMSKQGYGSRVLLHRISGVSHPTIKKAMRGEPIRMDCAMKIARVVGGTYQEMMEQAAR